MITIQNEVINNFLVIIMFLLNYFLKLKLLLLFFKQHHSLDFLLMELEIKLRFRLFKSRFADFVIRCNKICCYRLLILILK